MNRRESSQNAPGGSPAAGQKPRPYEADSQSKWHWVTNLPYQAESEEYPLSGGVFKEPQPEVLRPRAVAIAGFEAAGFGHGDRVRIGKRHAQPRILGGREERRVALHLKFKQSAGAQQTRHFTHVAVNHLSARNVLEDDVGESEVDLDIAQDAEVGAVVLEDVGVGRVLQRLASLADHFAADIHGVDLAENLRQRARNAAGSAADFENLHLLRVFALADVAHVRENFVADIVAAGFEIIFVGPVFIGRGDVMARIFAGALVPFPAHFFENCGGCGKRVERLRHLLYCNCS